MAKAANAPTTKRKRLRKYCSRNISKFLTETSLHGLKYVGDEELHLWERIFSLIAFVTAVIVAFNLAADIFYKWTNTPVLIGLNSRNIETVPFPALTICNMNQALRSKVSHYSEDSVEYAYLRKLCFDDIDYVKYDNLEPGGTDTFPNFIIKNCSSMLVFCQFGTETKTCSNFFREVLMDEGLCCVFNMLHPFYLYKGSYQLIQSHTTTTGRIPVDWNPETGYADNLPSAFYPRLPMGTGVSLGLNVILNVEVDEYFCSSTNGAGFKIFLHNPIDTPHIKDTGIPVMVGSQTRIRIDATSFEALPSVHGIRPASRQCYFNDEEQLFYYKYYTRRNCEMECDSMFLLRTCNCIPYYMPPIFANASSCHVKDFNCVSAAEKAYHNHEKLACKRKCLQSCFDLTFNPELFITQFARKNFDLQHPYFMNFTKEYIHENFALIQLYYTETSFVSNVRTAYTGFTEFLSQTGGILSFLMGFSVVSIAEISYYAIWRPIFEFLLSRRRVNAVPPERSWVKGSGVEYSEQPKEVFFVRRNYANRNGSFSEISPARPQPYRIPL